MKFDVASSELLKKLSIVSGAISPNPVLPVLEDFLFALQENVLTITATNLETSIVTSVDVMAMEGGTIAVPAKILLDTLKALPDQPITFSVEEETKGITIKSSYGEYKLAGDDSQDYPDIPSEMEVNSVVLGNEQIHNAITKTVFATSNDELRLSMTGILCQVDFNKLIFVATDAHKLVKYTFGNVSSETTESFIVPKKGFSLLKNALDDSEEVLMSFNKKNVFFSFANTKLICRLIDAKYPDYNAVIPVDNPHLLTLNRRDFQNSLKRIAIYANKTTNQVILNLTNNSLTISAQDLDFSNEATEQLACTYDGEPMTIGFNAKFLVEMLSVLESDDVMIELSTPNRAGILLPTEQAEGEHLLMLVMPVMMSN